MKIYIETLGCPKNMVDSESMAGLLETEGHQIIDDPETAEIIIVNTCGFINDAKRESIETIFEMASLKNQEQNDGNSPKRLIVTGCLSQRYQNDLYQEMPEVDLFLGVNEYHLLPGLLEKQSIHGERVFLDPQKSYQEHPVKKSKTVIYSSYLKIAEGCDNVCAYCVIPSIRGGYRSREQENILIEAKHFIDQGCKELILVAQDVTAYGIDLYGEYRLPALLRELCDLEGGLQWVRLLYCYEDRITDELIQVIAEQPKICKYLDIPIQHASDKILSSMNRRSNKASILSTITRLRQAIPDIHIRTTLITGFPGEKEQDYRELVEFVGEMRFDRLGVFAYSREEGTAAATMKPQVRTDTRERRRNELMALQQKISLEKNQGKIGTVLEVLTEEQEGDGATYLGRSAFDAPDIDNTVIFTSNRTIAPGDFVKVRILDAFDYDLTGEAIDEHTK